MSKQTNILRKLGFSEREVKVYMAGLELGAASASVIAQKAGVSRTLVYDALDRLMERGLVSRTGDNRKTLFVAEPPEAVRTMIARKRSELASMEAGLPNLLTRSVVTGKGVTQARIRVYSGIEGIKMVADDVLSAKSKMVRTLVPIKNVLDTVDRAYLQHWFSEIDRRGIKSHSLWSVAQRDPVFSAKGRELRMTPDDMQFPATMVLYDDKVAMFSMKRGKPTSLIVQNSEFGETLGAMFDTIWKQARPAK